MTNSEMHSAQRSTYSSVEDAALMRLLPDAAEAQVFSECVGNLQKSCATKLDMNLKRAKVLAYWSLRVASAERAHEILVFYPFLFISCHFLSCQVSCLEEVIPHAKAHTRTLSLGGRHLLTSVPKKHLAQNRDTCFV